MDDPKNVFVTFHFGRTKYMTWCDYGGFGLHGATCNCLSFQEVESAIVGNYEFSLKSLRMSL